MSWVSVCSVVSVFAFFLLIVQYCLEYRDRIKHHRLLTSLFPLCFSLSVFCLHVPLHSATLIFAWFIRMSSASADMVTCVTWYCCPGRHLARFWYGYSHTVLWRCAFYQMKLRLNVWSCFHQQSVHTLSLRRVWLRRDLCCWQMKYSSLQTPLPAPRGPDWQTHRQTWKTLWWLQSDYKNVWFLWMFLDFLIWQFQEDSVFAQMLLFHCSVDSHLHLI